MKAIVYTRYGNPDELRLEEVERPVPKEDEVLIRVRAASVNSWDWELLQGKPFMNRIGGLFRPKYPILGADVAGRVEAVGERVTRFQPDDEVFGDLCESGWGAFAEYTCAKEKALLKRSAGLAALEAAAFPQAAVMALQGIRDYGRVKQGDKVLIVGAGGGVGTFAIQLARMYGAEVTGVDSGIKQEGMCRIGAHKVIDYQKEDFTRNGERYDLILDMVSHKSMFAYRRSLRPGGRYIVVGGTMGAIFRILTIGTLLSWTGSRKMRILIHRPNKDLAFIRDLAEKQILPVIDKVYPLEEAASAIRRIAKGEVLGKAVIAATHFITDNKEKDQ